MILLALLTAHLLAEFVFQTEHRLRNHRSLNDLSKHLLQVLFLMASTLILFSFIDGGIQWDKLFLAGALLVIVHGILDSLEAWIPEWVRRRMKSRNINPKELEKAWPLFIIKWELSIFIAFQILHALSILLLSWIFLNLDLPAFILSLLIKLHIATGPNFTLQPISRVLLLCIMLILVTSFCSRVIQLVARKPAISEIVEEKITLEENHSDSKKEGKSSTENESKLKREYSFARINETEVSNGRLIGYFERIIIMILAFRGQYPAIAFIITAKSLFRFKQLDHREWAEYFLVGTLASVMLAIACGYFLRLLW